MITGLHHARPGSLTSTPPSDPDGDLVELRQPVPGGAFDLAT